MSVSRFHDPSQLTVFAPLPPENESPKTERSFVSRLFDRVAGSNAGSNSQQSTAVSRAQVASGNAVMNLAAAGADAEEFVKKGLAGVSQLQVDSTSPHYSERRASIYGINLNASTEQLVPVENGRTLENVLQRIKEISSKAPGELQPFRDADFKKFWVPDESAKECFECGEKFTAFRRRRHCRICGNLFCSRCVNQEIPGKSFGYSGSIRMCSFCSQIALTYARYLQGHTGSVVSDVAAAPHSQRRGSTGKKAIVSGETKYQNFLGRRSLPSEDDSSHRRRSSDSTLSFEQLREIWLELCHPTEGLELRVHRHRFRAFPDCITGSEIVDWMLRKKKIQGRINALPIGQGLVNFKFLEPLSSNDLIFADDYVLYRPKMMAVELENAAAANLVSVEQGEPTWLRDLDEPSSVTPERDESPEPEGFGFLFDNSRQLYAVRKSASNLSLNSQDSASDLRSESSMHSPQLAFSPVSQMTVDSSAFMSFPGLEQWRSASVNEGHDARQALTSPVPAAETTTIRSVSERMDDAFVDKIRKIVHQLRRYENLDDESWDEIILKLATKVCEDVVPNVQENHDDMDIRRYVHVKKIPGGQREENRIVYGVVCTKHVAHRKMRQNFVNPSIMLYGSSLDYQRPDEKLLSIGPVMQEEAKFLKSYVERIASLRPDILVVERHVSRLAQEYLFDENITLMSDMKQSVMRRLARQTNAGMYSLADQQSESARLGNCSKFDVKTVVLRDGISKSFATFDGCPKHLGCTVILRGASLEILAKVKRILRFIVFCRYNWLLEKAFILDEQADISMSTLSEDSHVESRLAEALERLELSMSPFIKVASPSAKSAVNPGNLQWLNLCSPSPEVIGSEQHLSEGTPAQVDNGVPQQTSDGTETCLQTQPSASLGPSKPEPTFLSLRFTKSVNHPSYQRALAEFRSRGYRYPKRVTSSTSFPSKPTRPAATQSTEIPECLSIYRHQRLPVLCSIHAIETATSYATFCVAPWILTIEFYGRNDLTLGDYLETFCFRSDVSCPNQRCQRGIRDHVRRFACGSSSLTVLIRSMERESTTPIKQILTWTWCKLCKEAGSVVPLGKAAWSLSFAKYVDLRLHSPGFVRLHAGNCQHSLHRDHLQFFAYGQTVACFQVGNLKIREVCPPKFVIQLDERKSLPRREDLIEVASLIAVRGHNLFATILDYLNSCQTLESDRISDRVSNLIVRKRAEKQLFRDRMDCIKFKLASPLLKLDPVDTAEDPVKQRNFVWDIEDSLSNLKRELTKLAVVWSSELTELDAAKRKEEKKQNMLKSFQSTPVLVRDEIPTVMVESPSSSGMDRVDFAIGIGDVDEVNSDEDGTKEPIPARKTSLRHSITSAGPLLQESPDAIGNVTNAPAQRTKSANVGSSINLVPLPFPPNEHFFFSESAFIPVVVNDEELGSIIAYTLSAAEYTSQLNELLKNSERGKPSQSSRTSRHTSGERSKYSPADGLSLSSLSASQNLLEKSSTISFLRELTDGPQDSQNVTQTTVDGNNMPSSSGEFNTATSKEHGKSKLAKSVSEVKQSQFIEIQFSDSVAKFYCRVYFPVEFRQLRSSVYPYGDERFIRALAHTATWKAGGGKSGSTFLKTSDGRFVLKQMSRLEVQSFMDLAPQYFEYLSECMRTGRPVVLTKIVGVYRVGFRNSQTGAVGKQDLLVMENLFYNRRVHQVYDLKGSLRNRLASTDFKADTELVLLDENFLKRSCDNPLYIRPEAKLTLRKALCADTQFLANMCVMDYSLLVGIDEDSNEILIGIIDYIRTFTWDKRLEMVVKSSGILGGQGKLPTIVSPELYRTRFIEAMDRYFLPVPDQWYGFENRDRKPSADL